MAVRPLLFFSVAIPLLSIVLITSIIVCDDKYWIDVDGVPTLIRNSEELRYNSLGVSNDILTQSQPLKNLDVSTGPDDSLPQALQPVKYKFCCEMRSGSLQPSGNKCKDPCFTPKACKDELYPYSSNYEKNLFYQDRQRWKTPKWRRPWIDKCVGLMTEKPSQPFQWCQQKNLQGQRQLANFNKIPMGCSMVMGMGGMSGPFDRTIIFPKGKLALCGIPKVGISSWLQFLRFTIGAKDYQSLPHQKSEIPFFRFDRLRPGNQYEVLNSPNWTRAVFLRNPAERFLSAYLDKVDGSELSWLKQIPNMTFADFVDFVSIQNTTCQEERDQSTQSGITWCMDPHWRPQAWSCGLWELLPHYDFIGSIDSANKATRAILERANLWDSHGKHYITTKSHSKQDRVCRMLPPQPSEIDEEHKGFQQYNAPVTNKTGKLYTHRHRKNSSSKLKEYYTKELLDKVKILYADDYLLWNALSKTKSGWLHGKEIAAILNPSCSVD